MVLIFDYAHQLGVPHLSGEMMETFWVSKNALDVNLFGVMNDGAGKYGLSTQYLLPERLKSVLDAVCTMLQHYIINNAKMWAAHDLYLCNNSFSGQIKGNIVEGYLMLFMHNGIYDAVDWRFFVAGHSKFH